MIRIISNPSVINAAGTKPKLIEEFIGRVNSATPDLSLARMTSPEGWTEPGQRPDFDEYTLVLQGCLQVESISGIQEVLAGQAIICPKGEWVRYSTPKAGGAHYIAVCLPAFSPNAVHRDE